MGGATVSVVWLDAGDGGVVVVDPLSVPVPGPVVVVPGLLPVVVGGAPVDVWSVAITGETGLAPGFEVTIPPGVELLG